MARRLPQFVELRTTGVDDDGRALGDIEGRRVRVKNALPDKLGAALADPPRSGLGSALVEALSDCTDRLAYVSCNPATFARDAQPTSRWDTWSPKSASAGGLC